MRWLCLALVLASMPATAAINAPTTLDLDQAQNRLLEAKTQWGDSVDTENLCFQRSMHAIEIADLNLGYVQSKVVSSEKKELHWGQFKLWVALSQFFFDAEQNGRRDICQKGGPTP